MGVTSGAGKWEPWSAAAAAAAAADCSRTLQHCMAVQHTECPSVPSNPEVTVILLLMAQL